MSDRSSFLSRAVGRTGRHIVPGLTWHTYPNTQRFDVGGTTPALPPTSVLTPTLSPCSSSPSSLTSTSVNQHRQKQNERPQLGDKIADALEDYSPITLFTTATQCTNSGSTHTSPISTPDIVSALNMKETIIHRPQYPARLTCVPSRAAIRPTPVLHREPSLSMSSCMSPRAVTAIPEEKSSSAHSTGDDPTLVMLTPDSRPNQGENACLDKHSTVKTATEEARERLLRLLTLPRTLPHAPLNNPSSADKPSRLDPIGVSMTRELRVENVLDAYEVLHDRRSIVDTFLQRENKRAGIRGFSDNAPSELTEMASSNSSSSSSSSVSLRAHSRDRQSKLSCPVFGLLYSKYVSNDYVTAHGDLLRHADTPNISLDAINLNLSLQFRNGQLTNANETLLFMKKLRLAPDVVTYNILISGFTKLERFDLALASMENMKKAQVPPNKTTFSIIAGTLSRHNGPRRAFSPFRHSWL